MSGRTPDPDDVSVTKTETLPSCSLNPIWVRSTRLVSTQVKVVNWRVTKSRKSLWVRRKELIWDAVLLFQVKMFEKTWWRDVT